MLTCGDYRPVRPWYLELLSANFRPGVFETEHVILWSRRIVCLTKVRLCFSNSSALEANIIAEQPSHVGFDGHPHVLLIHV